MERCPTCSTPLEDDGKCVTCVAAADGLLPLTRSDYASVREMKALLEADGLSPQMERVPPANEREQMQPVWNLYVPGEEAERAHQVLGGDWKSLLEGDAALEAALRGSQGVDLDAGAEITCPACGHAFVPGGGEVECPECGLGLGAPG